MRAGFAKRAIQIQELRFGDYQNEHRNIHAWTNPEQIQTESLCIHAGSQRLPDNRCKHSKRSR